MPVALGRQPLRLGDIVAGSSTRWHEPPCASISAIFSGLVEAGMTATNGRPRNRAKYASETAVEPLEASTSVVRSVIQPLHRP